MNEDRLTYLFNRYFDKTATEEERRELMSLMQNASNEDQLKALMDEAWDQTYPDDMQLTLAQSDREFDQILKMGRQTTDVHRMPGVRKRLNWRRFSAAASIIFIFSASFYLWLNHNSGTTSETNKPGKTAYANDIGPGNNTAVLTLTDGTRVTLDSMSTGHVTRQGNASLTKPDGNTLAYRAGGDSSKEILYNTLSTPRGGQYRLSLADGTNVWLNASSSLRFPTAFKGKERRVVLSGEGYFEVAHDPSMPFKVEIASGGAGMPGEIEVLGTHFNVMAYNDERFQNTTLLEGSVRIKSGTGASLLKPGQQARVNPTGVINVTSADVEAAIAWKNGDFMFNEDDVETIMRQVSRWYNVDVVFDGKIPDRHFSGVVHRNNNLSQVLKIMEAGGVGFKITGRTIHVL